MRLMIALAAVLLTSVSLRASTVLDSNFTETTFVGSGLSSITGMAWATALGLAFASDTLSMTTMEFVDNAIMLIIPGAMEAGLPDPLFWGSLAVSLALAGAAAFPVNRFLIARGKGHALVHGHHCH